MSVPTQVGAHLWLDAFLGDDRGTGVPATLYVALLTDDPRTGGVEVTGTGYARVSLANTDAVWGSPVSGTKDANAAFPAATGTWTTARWWAAAGGASSTDWCLAGRLSQPVSLTNGDPGPIVTCVVRVDQEF